ncbi:hypothetical protein IGI04_010178 [Brassica rapa subsp. trilocularis]|uniref:Uncharacterized protein n=2 Tax=Brassica rapa subsp. trilocularis TaxID=1813537 RepID=A0ABQ7MZE8_BRACM|nr:hypothetical protein IGI04_010178 [Brassica rapa subsp. trilocularis]
MIETENRSAMPFQIIPSPKKLVLHDSHKNLPSHNPIWKQLPLPCLEGLCLDDLCFEAMVRRSTGIAYVFLSRFIGQAIEGYDGQEDGIKFFGLSGNLTEDALD